ncbi:MAG: hypothetical protein U0X73_10365 [Thermoanaerobaculia bacterium]
MSRPQPNLARAPFLNTRPVGRLSAILWVLALGLATANFWVYLRYTSGSIEKQHELELRLTSISEAKARSAALEQELAALDLAAENDEVRFLNDRIAERTFSWNLLIDRVVETLPDGVRLISLVPATGDRNPSTLANREAIAPAARRVELRISGSAEDGEQLLQFVDALFAHPAFEEPNLLREHDTQQGTTDFELRVDYLPEAPVGPRLASPGSTRASVAAPSAPAGEETAATGAEPIAGAPTAEATPDAAKPTAAPGGASVTAGSLPAPAPASAARDRLSAAIEARQRAFEEATGGGVGGESEIVTPADERAGARRGLGPNPRAGGAQVAPMFVPVPLGRTASGDHRR